MVRYQDGVHSTRNQVGVVNGLAWTEVGGEILEVEAGVMEGSGKLELTGNLGTVMQGPSGGADVLAEPVRRAGHREGFLQDP
ncbi:MAG: S16 family serine protease [Oscillospiraceae bacterium]